MLRDRFPALGRATYLNTAGGAPIPDVVHEAAVAYYRQSLDDGDVHWDAWMDQTDNARAEVGRLVGCPPQHVAFVGNASVGLNLAALLDEPGAVGFPVSEFPSCTLPWLRRGFRAVPWKVAVDGSFDADDVRWALRQGVRVVVVSWVQFTTGFRADLGAIAEACRSEGARLVVDATQGVAAFPLSAEADGVDVLVFSGYKWMTSGYGAAGLAMPGGLPEAGSPFAGWRSQADPFALESGRLAPSRDGLAAEAGHPPFPCVFGMGAAAGMWNNETPQRTAQTIHGLMDDLYQRVDRLGLEIFSPRDRSHQSGILQIGVENPKEVAAGLKKRGVLTSARRKGLRVSVHAYNSVEDLDAFEHALQEVLR